MSKPPVNVYEKGLDRVAARLETPEVIKRISLRLAYALAAVAVAQGIAILAMLPLKERVPYFVEARSDGAVVASQNMATLFTPGERHMAYFIWNRFALPMLTIDEQTSRRLPHVMEVVRGAARDQVIEYINHAKIGERMLKDPTLRQDVALDGRIEFVKNDKVSGFALMWAIVKSRSAKSGSVDKRVRIKIDYVLLPVKDDMEVLRNPIGMYITGFKIEDLYAK